MRAEDRDDGDKSASDMRWFEKRKGIRNQGAL